MSEEFNLFFRRYDALPERPSFTEKSYSYEAWQACATIKDKELADEAQQYEDLREQYDREVSALAAENAELRIELHKLACLGNGDMYGNSIGNVIAQQALAAPSLGAELLRKRDDARDVGYVEQLKHANDRIAELMDTKFKRFNEEDCWIYMDDEDNGLESLTCPIVISVESLRKRDARTASKVLDLVDQHWCRGDILKELETLCAALDMMHHTKMKG